MGVGGGHQRHRSGGVADVDVVDVVGLRSVIMGATVSYLDGQKQQSGSEPRPTCIRKG